MLTALLVAVVSSAVPDAGVASAPQPVMREALGALVTLAPLLPNGATFREPAHQKEVTGALDVLVRVKHPFLRKPGASSTGVAELFSKTAAIARDDFAAGRTEPARRQLQGLTQLCLSCHLREPSQDFADAAKVVEQLHLAPLQEAQYCATTRQFDRALALWKTELAKPVKLEAEVFEQLEALKVALEVAVRARDDAKLAQQLIAPQLKRTGLPGFAQRELKQWHRDAVSWEKEGFVMSAQKPAALVTKARALISGTGALQNVAPVAEHFLVLLRAASYLDEALRQDPDGPSRGEALYLLGVVHASVSGPVLWQLEWTYFEACIRENPKTPLAQQCAERLKERTWFNWRTSADMPARTEAALNELLSIAK
jgi:hypothetical protein